MSFFKKKHPIDYDTFIGITDDYMFCTVMEDVDKCKEFLQRVLKIEIKSIKVISSQKHIRNRKGSHGIRLDVYVTDYANNTYDIEMQTTFQKDLAKRTRYYHSEMDGYLIRKGENYSKLGRNIVIFVCTFDFFNENKSIYTFRNTCKESSNLLLDDGLETIILNIHGNREDIDESLSNVLDYMKTGTPNDDYTQSIADSVSTLNNDNDWRDRQMTIGMKLYDKYLEGLEEGESIGLEQSLQIINLYSQGVPVAKIAKRLSIKSKTVKNYIVQYKSIIQQ